MSFFPNTLIRIVSVALLWVAVLCTQPAHANATLTKAQLSDAANELINDYKQLAQAQRDIEQCRVRRVIRRKIDLDAMTLRALEPQRTKITSSQFTQILSAFRALIERLAFVDAKADFATHPYTLSVNVKTQTVSLDTYLPEEDIDLTLAARFATVKRKPVVTDVWIDGASLVTDYANQFARVIANDGPEILLQRIQEKHSQIEAKDICTGILR